MRDQESRLRFLLYKWALKNALDHGGKAQEKPVIAKVVAEDPGAKAAMSFLLQEVKAVVGARQLDGPRGDSAGPL
jgi:hypothetical protein